MISLRTLCLLHRGGRVLLLRRRRPPNAGLWNAVGGKVTPGEDPYGACAREVREETGLRIARPRLRAVEVVAVRTTGERWALLVFTAHAPPGEPVASEEGELRWVDARDPGALPVPADLRLLWPLLWSTRRVLTARADLEREDASSMIRLEVLGPASCARVLFPP